jgi:hypothetical protein
MALDLSKVPQAARERYVEMGKRFGSELTLRQADHTLDGLDRHAGTLAGFGFSYGDGARLKEARDLLLQAGIGREPQAGERKRTSTEMMQAMQRAKAARKRGQAILLAVLDHIEELGLSAKRPALLGVAAQIRSSGEDAELLGQQLDLLRATFSGPDIAKAASDRGGPESVRELEEAAKVLREAAEVSRSSPSILPESERLDLLDGIIIELVRGARRSARAAASALGQPALARDFDLVHLYPGGGDEPSSAGPTP